MFEITQFNFLSAQAQLTISYGSRELKTIQDNIEIIVISANQKNRLKR